MEINGSYGVGSLWNLDEIENIGSRKKTSLVQGSGNTGDTVEISDEAKKLFSQMIHKYDAPATSSGSAGEESAQNENGGEAAQNTGGGGGGESSDTNSVEALKKQIESLKSQLSALAGQIGSGADSATMSKMNALEAQIAALQAQLNEMGA